MQLKEETMKISKQKLIQALEKEKVELPASVYAVPGGRVRETFNTGYNEAIDKVISIVNSMKGEE